MRLVWGGESLLYRFRPARATLIGMSRDWPVIYRAFDIAEADIVVNWLSDRGIDAAVKDRFAAGTFEVPQIVAPYGIEVCTMNPSQTDDAKNALAEFLKNREMQVNARSAEPIVAECEECGKSSTYLGNVRGRVENCKHCDAYIDVPN